MVTIGCLPVTLICSRALLDVELDDAAAVAAAALLGTDAGSAESPGRGLPSRSAFSRAAFSARAFLSASIWALIAARALASSILSVRNKQVWEKVLGDERDERNVTNLVVSVPLP